MTVPFSDLGLSPEVLRAVVEVGYEETTPIQEQTIPLLLAGRDVIAQAQTGTGKTAAFALPTIERIDPKQVRPQALILAPTRELVIQVAGAMHKLGKYRELAVVPIYGGQPIERQLRSLRHGVHIVVGTPGRLMDHMRRGTLSLEGIATVILDEADEMLDMGFLEDIEYILAQAPSDRQTALFSATIPMRINVLARTYMRDAITISIEAEKVTVPQIRQTYYEVRDREKLDALTRILDFESPDSVIIFCARKSDVDELGETLQGRGYTAETLHGDLSQVQRDRVMRRFRDNTVEVLVATDVAARGLDIVGVSHVINYDIPWDPESYVHRIGRTGRAGRKGEAITLVTPRERRLLSIIERHINKRLKPARLPSQADIAARRRDRFKDSILQVIDEGSLDAYLRMVDDLIAAAPGDEGDGGEKATHDPRLIAAAAFKLLEVPDTAPEQSVNEPPALEADGLGVEQGMVRIFVSAGRRQNVRPQDLVGAIANEAGLRGQEIGVIDIYDDSSFVEVPQRAADRVIIALRGTTLRGQRVNVDKARPPDGHSRPPATGRGGKR